MNNRVRYAYCYAWQASTSKLNRPFWYCAFTTPDGKRHFKSTKAADKKQARAIANEWERAVREGRRGLLTPEKARDVIARGVAEVFAAVNQEGNAGIDAGSLADALA